MNAIISATRALTLSAIADWYRVLGSCLFLLLMMALAVTDADAGCSSRPGTPNEERAVAISDTEISYSWRVTDSGTIYYDMYILGPNSEDVGKNRTGDGPYRSRAGRRDGTTFKDLKPNTGYCVAIRARTEAGTQGCISKRASS
jgi:hypothetical protein